MKPDVRATRLTLVAKCLNCGFVFDRLLVNVSKDMPHTTSFYPYECPNCHSFIEGIEYSNLNPVEGGKKYQTIFIPPER